MVKRTFYFVKFKNILKERFPVEYVRFCYSLPASSENLIVEEYVKFELEDSDLHKFEYLLHDVQ